MARAPKLSRRAKGEAGTLEVGASPSSKGDSSTVPELELEKLSPRERAVPKGDVWFGEPERPTVVSERRRCWAWAAADVIGPMVVGGFVAAFEGRLPNMSTNEPAIDERRLPLAFGEGRGGELRSEEAMVRKRCASERKARNSDEGGYRLRKNCRCRLKRQARQLE
jgi:hypothetical protein